MKTILQWIDPEDYDNALNHGTEIFDTNDQMIDRLNNLQSRRPKIEFLAFDSCRELKIEPVKVTTAFRINNQPEGADDER